ncbi:hypothetical protein RN001_001533 [Aquatica leii]|uniref:N-acetylneuraminate lyase n=1 Tax=Aquatica leii TaxID=1421715 RepID=A0AAN7Q7X3_9COLE|nr:hypothetical protein RN001_001533 [Aquatica leii]
MEDLEIGVRFPSYRVLMHYLEKFSEETQSKFWKRDARTIGASRSLGITKYLNPDIIYFEIKFTCVYGGMDFKTKGRNIRPRQPSLKTSGCPVYLRFKASQDGETLQLVAKNLNHNHELKPERKKRTGHDSSQNVEAKKHKQEKEDEEEVIEKTEFVEKESSPEKEMVDCVLQDENLKINVEYLKYQGLIAPVFTPFHDDLGRTLNLEVLPAYAQYLIDAGISGVLVNGTTGEGMSMSVEERKLVTEVWSQLCNQGQLHLMVQIGGASLPDVLELAQHAEQVGANSLLCLPELFHKPNTCEDLIRYLQIVSQAAPYTPLFYYHIPGLTGVNLNMGEFLRKITGEISTFSGIKFTSTVLDEGYAAVTANDGKYSVFLGADTVMAGAYALGFDSAIATTLNIFPQYGQQILQCIKDGNITEAQSKQSDLNSAIGIITKNGTWVPTMKIAMNLLTSLNVGPTREPLKSLTAVEESQMETELKGLSFITS